MSWLRKSRCFRQLPLMKISIVCMANIFKGLELPSPDLVQYGTRVAITSTTPMNLSTGVIYYTFFMIFWLAYIHFTSGTHVWMHFYLPSQNFTLFLFFSATPFSVCSCLLFFHLIPEFELDLYNISSQWSKVRALHFYSFAVWLASNLVRPWVYNIKPKKEHQLPT